MGLDSVFFSARSLASLAFMAFFPALAPSRARRSQKTSSDSDPNPVRLFAQPSQRRAGVECPRRTVGVWSPCGLSDACSSRASRLPRRATSLFSRITSLRSSPRSARRGLDRGLLVLRPLQGRTQPARLLVRLCDRPAPGRLDAGFGKQLLQARDFGLQGKGILRRAANLLRLFDCRLQFVAAAVDAATSANPRGHGASTSAQRSSSARASARPLASTLAPPGHAPARTGTATRAPRAPAPARRATNRVVPSVSARSAPKSSSRLAMRGN